MRKKKNKDENEEMKASRLKKQSYMIRSAFDTNFLNNAGIYAHLDVEYNMYI